jgi:hypothetical protein
MSSLCKMQNLPIIAIDIGGTIEDSWNSKRIWFKSKGFDIGIWPKGRREIVKYIGGSESLYEKMVIEVYNDENIIDRELIEGFLESIKIIAPYFKIVIVSSRDEQKRKITIEWMKRKKIFDLVDEIIFLGDKGNKLDWCISAKVKFFIDDDIRHFEPIEVVYSITRILLCQCPGELPITSPNIISAISWKEILKIIQNASS